VCVWILKVRFEPVDGHFLLTASYDHSAKVWSAHNFTLVKSLTGHENKVMGADIARGGEVVATASYDRTFKLWQQQPQSEQLGVGGGDTDVAMEAA
jgi:U4/U6 small nuclear ribonucleoprotein PRP4